MISVVQEKAIDQYYEFSTPLATAIFTQSSIPFHCCLFSHKCLFVLKNYTRFFFNWGFRYLTIPINFMKNVRFCIYRWNNMNLVRSRDNCRIFSQLVCKILLRIHYYFYVMCQVIILKQTKSKINCYFKYKVYQVISGVNIYKNVYLRCKIN